MGAFIKGEVVVLPFPFSDLSASKRRPALVVANLSGDDVILCQITASRSDTYSIQLDSGDFSEGSLNRPSNIRPNRLFTADSGIINYCAGRLKADKVAEVIDRLIQIIQ